MTLSRGGPVSKQPEDWMLLKAAEREFGLDYRWLRKQLKKGVVRSKKIPGTKYVLVSRSDVAKLATPDLQLLARLLEEERRAKAAPRGKGKRKS